MSTPIFRQFTFAAKMDGDIRVAKYNDTDHIVVPTIAIMEGVVWPYASETRELVLESELEKMDVRSWNGRPITMDHPMNDGRAVAANDPKVLDKYLFGHVFNAELRKKKLHVESWLNLDRALKIGADAQSVINRAKRKEEIEVSVGVFIRPEEKSGVYEGTSYEIIWRDITADHLAMLPEETIGACSVEMGCGAPRVARAATRKVHVFLSDHLEIKEKIMPAPTAQEERKEKQRSLRERLQATFGFKAAEADEGDLSMNALWESLNKLLYADEPAFQGVVDVMPNEKSVIYAVMPDSEFKMFRRKYSVDGDNVVLGGQRKEVQPVTRYETLEAEQPPTNNSSCGCGGNQAMDKKARVSALIASKKNGFTAASASVLESLNEDHLKALEDADAAVPEQAAGSPPAPQPGTSQPSTPPSTPGTQAPSTPPSTPPAPKQLSAAEQEAEWRRTAPPSILSMLDDKIAQDAAERNVYVTALEGRKVYTKHELEAMPLPDLRKVAALANVEVSSAPSGAIDFSLRGVPRAASAADETVPAPRRLSDNFGAKKAS